MLYGLNWTVDRICDSVVGLRGQGSSAPIRYGTLQYKYRALTQHIFISSSVSNQGSCVTAMTSRHGYPGYSYLYIIFIRIIIQITFRLPGHATQACKLRPN